MPDSVRAKAFRTVRKTPAAIEISTQVKLQSHPHRTEFLTIHQEMRAEAREDGLEGIWKRGRMCHCEELEATKQSLVPLRLLRYARNDVSREFQNTLLGDRGDRSDRFDYENWSSSIDV